MLAAGLVTESFFYTMLEAGMALIAVNMPSWKVFSISLMTGSILRSVRSLLELSFLRSSTDDIALNESKPPSTSGTNEPGEAKSFNTRPSESSSVVQGRFPPASHSFLQDTERQSQDVARI